MRWLYRRKLRSHVTQKWSIMSRPMAVLEPISWWSAPSCAMGFSSASSTLTASFTWVSSDSWRRAAMRRLRAKLVSRFVWRLKLFKAIELLEPGNLTPRDQFSKILLAFRGNSTKRLVHLVSVSRSIFVSRNNKQRGNVSKRRTFTASVQISIFSSLEFTFLLSRSCVSRSFLCPPEAIPLLRGGIPECFSVVDSAGISCCPFRDYDADDWLKALLMLHSDGDLAGTIFRLPWRRRRFSLFVFLFSVIRYRSTMSVLIWWTWRRQLVFDFQPRKTSDVTGTLYRATRFWTRKFSRFSDATFNGDYRRL